MHFEPRGSSCDVINKHGVTSNDAILCEVEYVAQPENGTDIAVGGLRVVEAGCIGAALYVSGINGCPTHSSAVASEGEIHLLCVGEMKSQSNIKH